MSFKKAQVSKPGIKKPGPITQTSIQTSQINQNESFSQVRSILSSKYTDDEIKNVLKEQNYDLAATITKLKQIKENFEQNQQLLLVQALSEQSKDIQLDMFISSELPKQISFVWEKEINIKSKNLYQQKKSLKQIIEIPNDILCLMKENFSKPSRNHFMIIE